MKKKKDKKLGLWEAVSMAVGTMIGAGIFSILGVGAQICHQNLPEAFALAALVSLSVAYSYAKLGSAYVSNAGPIEFILRGIGDNVITGTLAILMWFSYVISISLFAKAFSGYFLAIFHLNITPVSSAVIEVLIISIFTALNFFGSKAVGKAEFWIVLIKVSILLSFVVIGIWSIKPSLLKPAIDTSSVIYTIYAATVLFLTYMGFGLITNASENIENPRKTVPKAIYISIGIVAVIYISVAVVAMGNLGYEGLIKAKEYALAEAAKPFLGDIGFVFVAIGALFSTASAINATLYGGANVAYALAKKGELPEVFERKTWFEAPEGLYITSFLSLMFALFFNLGGIANLISTVFLIIYIFVIASHYRLFREAGGNRGLILLNFVIIFSVFVMLMIYQWKTNKGSFFTSIGIFAFSMIFEAVYRSITKRKFVKRKQKRFHILDLIKI